MEGLPSRRALEQRRHVTDYFLEQVDPVLARCVAFLLSSGPKDDVALAMLEFLLSLESGQAPRASPWAGSRTEQRAYLAERVGPVVAAVIAKVARAQPREVIPFLIAELRLMAGSDSHPSEGPATDDSSYSGLTGIHAKPDRPEAPAAASGIPVAPMNELKAQKADAMGKRDVHIALLGIDGAGKTSVLNSLQGNVGAKVRPTIGFRPVSMGLDEGTNITLYDLGGGPKIRDIWSQYYHDVHGVIFVLDASTSERWQEAVEVFCEVTAHPKLQFKPILVLANKQDVEGAKTAEDIHQALSIADFPMGRVFPCSAIGTTAAVAETDPRIEKGVEWLLETVLTQFSELQDRVMIDTKVKAEEEMRRRLDRERKVLRSKIAESFFDSIDHSVIPGAEPAKPDDIFSPEEGADFLAAEIGVLPGSLDPLAIEICALVGQQRLALAIIGGLYCPVSKKKTAMSWKQIKELVLEVRSELGLQ